jgi:hypothetical protein
VDFLLTEALTQEPTAERAWQFPWRRRAALVQTRGTVARELPPMTTDAVRACRIAFSSLLLAGLGACDSSGRVTYTARAETPDESSTPGTPEQAAAADESSVQADPAATPKPLEPPVSPEPTVQPPAPSAQPPPTAQPSEPAMPQEPPAVGTVIWDDFNYASWKDPLAGQFGWRFRNGTGWPGNYGGWSPDQIAFVTDPDDPSNTLMRLESYTDGRAGASTVQTQVSRQPPNVFHGTFAARTRFRPLASVGPDNSADQLTQTFYMIVGIEGTYADPGYPLQSYEPYQRTPHSELDFEFLPHGGWGRPSTAMTVSTWAPDLASYGVTDPKYAGWHVWSITFDGKRVVYSMDGAVFHQETGAMPETVMSMSFNQWFIGLGIAGDRREYWEDVDWVFYADQEYLTNAQILERVGKLRSAGVARMDTMK